MLDRAAADEWIRSHAEPAGPIEVASEEPWATVLRVPLAHGVAWFKACAAATAFEVRLTAELHARWPGRVAEVLACDVERAWLLLADAGTPIAVYGDVTEAWLAVLPRYAELQRGEAAHADEHLAHGVPDLRLARVPERYEEMLRSELPLEPDELARLRAGAQRVPTLCEELAAHGIPASVQHDDLHMANVYADGATLRVLDWGDACISHPFASLFETFRFLEGVTKLPPGDPWFPRLRDAYLEPWGGIGDDLVGAFELALRVGALAHAIAWARQREQLRDERRTVFDPWFGDVLRRAAAAVA